MNRLLIVLAVAGIILTGSFVSGQARALDFYLSEEHQQSIRQNCVTTQTTLQQLHASDGVLRVNLGKIYENMSNKLMAPLNSRIALNRQEGLQLAATALEYDRQLDVFRASYKQYEESMSRTLKINCAENPVEFYSNIISTRQKREKLHQDTKTLSALLRDYKGHFENFATKITGDEA